MTKKLIIHFTLKFDTIKSIVQSKSLRLSYSKEDFYMGNKKVSSAAHPMVCFSGCDINELSNKKITYGKYGIGFSNSWATRNKISPVIYINQNSMAANGLGRLLQARRNKLNSELPKHLRLPIIQLKCFTKNERGYNSYFNQKDFNFKDENEWRFVPEKKDIGNGLISQDKSRYLKKQEEYNKKLHSWPLRFKASEIEIIFVSNSEEKSKIENLIPLIKDKVKIYSWKT